MKTYLNNRNENKDIIYSTSYCGCVQQKIVNFPTTPEVRSTQEPKKCLENSGNNDDNMFAYPSNVTEVLKTLGDLKSIEAFGNDSVSDEALKSSLPVTAVILTEISNLCLSTGWSRSV